MKQISEGLWVAEQPLRFWGVPVGARMTVVRVDDGLLLYSPIEATSERVAAVTALGPIRYLLAPNNFHHLFVGGWQKAAPAAETFIARGLAKKRTDLPHVGFLDERAAPFGRDVEHLAVKGAPLVGETVLFHRPSSTLVCCDLVHNVLADAPFGQRLFMRLVGGYGGVKTNLLDKITARDRPAMRAAVEEMVAWQPTRLIPAHGHICDSDGAARLQAAYRWLLA